jgi:hypothetical protein
VQTWKKARRVVAKVEWHSGELYPRVGFIVTNLARPAERVGAFYNQRGTCEQFIKEGKGAIKWTRLSCRTFGPPTRFACRFVHWPAISAISCNPDDAKDREAVVADQLAREADQDRREGRSYDRYITFQLAEVAVSRQMFAIILSLIARVRTPSATV